MTTTSCSHRVSEGPGLEETPDWDRQWQEWAVGFWEEYPGQISHRVGSSRSPRERNNYGKMLGSPEQMNGCLPELCSFCTILAVQGIEPEAFHTPCALPLMCFPGPEFVLSVHVHVCARRCVYVYGDQR